MAKLSSLKLEQFELRGLQNCEDCLLGSSLGFRGAIIFVSRAIRSS